MSRTELDEDERAFITELFFEAVVPKLRNLHARVGTVNCEFAGEAYRNWNILFRSKGSGFHISGFEYDEEACGFDLDL